MSSIGREDRKEEIKCELQIKERAKKENNWQICTVYSVILE